jgi:hypothetical protein
VTVDLILSHHPFSLEAMNAKEFSIMVIRQSKNNPCYIFGVLASNDTIDVGRWHSYFWSSNTNDIRVQIFGYRRTVTSFVNDNFYTSII